MPKSQAYQATCRVCPEYGTIHPMFRIGGNYTSGTLKYFSALKGKRIRITIEVLDDHEETAEDSGNSRR